MMTKNLLLKTFSVSLFVHIAGISLFSLVFPSPRPDRSPIEISLLPPSATRGIIEITGTAPVHEIPKATSRNKRLALARERETIRIPAELFTESTQYMPVYGYQKFKIPESQIKLPDIISFKSLENTIERTPANVDQDDGKTALRSFLGLSGSPEFDVYPEQTSKKWVFEPVKTPQKSRNVINF